MECPKCNGDMDFDEAKNNHGTWHCEDCEFEAPGSKIPCEGEYFTDSPAPVACDWEEKFDEKDGGFISDEDAKDMHDEEKFQNMRDGE